MARVASNSGPSPGTGLGFLPDLVGIGYGIPSQGTCGGPSEEGFVEMGVGAKMVETGNPNLRSVSAEEAFSSWDLEKRTIPKASSRRQRVLV